MSKKTLVEIDSKASINFSHCNFIGKPSEEVVEFAMRVVDAIQENQKLLDKALDMVDNSITAVRVSNKD
ncbi:MAG TPA: hypothetical protein VFM18_02920 [Methanosarcina sp.]|nr:hypothetical protein [Methanosarcina sp.]